MALEVWLRYTCAHPARPTLPMFSDLVHTHRGWEQGTVHFVHQHHAARTSCPGLPVHLNPANYTPLTALPAFTSANSMRLWWTGWAGSYTGETCSPEEGVLQQLKVARPGVLVFNFAFHWLHSTSYASFEPRASCIMRRWLQYEEHISLMIALAAKANVRLVLYKTVSRSCDNGWNPWSRHRLERWRSMSASEQLNICRGKYGHMLAAGSHFLRGGLDNYCINASFDDIGSARLNGRAIAHIARHKSRWAQELGVKVAIFADRGTQDCARARDSVHHWELAYARLHTLSKTLHKLRAQQADVQDSGAVIGIGPQKSRNM